MRYCRCLEGLGRVSAEEWVEESVEEWESVEELPQAEEWESVEESASAEEWLQLIQESQGETHRLAILRSPLNTVPKPRQYPRWQTPRLVPHWR
jgi:hypothetical protein